MLMDKRYLCLILKRSGLKFFTITIKLDYYQVYLDYGTEIIEKKYLEKCWMRVDGKKEEAMAFEDRLRRICISIKQRS